MVQSTLLSSGSLFFLAREWDSKTENMPLKVSKSINKDGRDGD